jgi:hypothetical protein
MIDRSRQQRTTRRDFMGGALAGGLGSHASLFARGQEKTTRPPEAKDYISIQIEDGPNPWTHLHFNNKDADFQFAILADQTGYINWEVFKDSINKVNLLQPEFVMTVGDLIEGNNSRPEIVSKQWDDFDAQVNRLQMPFYYLPGNHDLRIVGNSKICAKTWRERLGRTYYHFTYHDVLFLCVSTEDFPPEPAYTWANSYIGPEQVTYFEKVLAENQDVRWTMVFMHEPLYEKVYFENYGSNGWEGIEAALQGRKYTVLAGHTHTHDKIIRKGQKYITLATTGGGKNHAKKGPHVGDFDHITWCTMKDDGPVFAHIDVDAIWDEDVYTRERAHLVKTVIGKKFAIACSPIRIKTDTFKAVTTELTLENNTNYPMRLDGHFQQHELLRPFPYAIVTEMPAHSKNVLMLQISSESEVAVKDLKPLLFQRTVYCRPDSRPEIPYQEIMEIKIGKA